jgi:hypothetical protein
MYAGRLLQACKVGNWRFVEQKGPTAICDVCRLSGTLFPEYLNVLLAAACSSGSPATISRLISLYPTIGKRPSIRFMRTFIPVEVFILPRAIFRGGLRLVRWVCMYSIQWESSPKAIFPGDEIMAIVLRHCERKGRKKLALFLSKQMK